MIWDHELRDKGIVNEIPVAKRPSGPVGRLPGFAGRNDVARPAASPARGSSVYGSIAKSPAKAIPVFSSRPARVATLEGEVEGGY